MDSRENGKAIPEEELEQVAGGVGVELGDIFDGATCPNCGSKNTHAYRDSTGMEWEYHWHCRDCDYQWIEIK